MKPVRISHKGEKKSHQTRHGLGRIHWLKDMCNKNTNHRIVDNKTKTTRIPKTEYGKTEDGFYKHSDVFACLKSRTIDRPFDRINAGGSWQSS